MSIYRDKLHTCMFTSVDICEVTHPFNCGNLWIFHLSLTISLSEIEWQRYVTLWHDILRTWICTTIIHVHSSCSASSLHAHACTRSIIRKGRKKSVNMKTTQRRKKIMFIDSWTKLVLQTKRSLIDYINSSKRKRSVSHKNSSVWDCRYTIQFDIHFTFLPWIRKCCLENKRNASDLSRLRRTLLLQFLS